MAKILSLKNLIENMLEKLIIKNPSLTFVTPTTGVLVTNSARTCGNVAHLYLSGSNSNSVGPGDVIFQAKLWTPMNLKPIQRVTTGSYYGRHACNAIFDTDGMITIKNASSTAFTPSDGVSVSFTYIFNTN